MSDHYRQAASILLLKPVQVCAPGGACKDLYHILLLHKPRKNDAWQLPQGGVEGDENTEQAALRELNEEAGITGCTILGSSEKCYQYDFPASFRRFKGDDVCGQCIRYVMALAPADVHVQVDGKEIDNHVWVDLSQVNHYLTRDIYRDMVHDLYAEALDILSSAHTS